MSMEGQIKVMKYILERLVYLLPLTKRWVYSEKHI